MTANRHYYDPAYWYVDESGNRRLLADHGPDNVQFVDHYYPTPWVEVEVLALPDGEPGREVVCGYVLHRGPYPGEEVVLPAAPPN